MYIYDSELCSLHTFSVYFHFFFSSFMGRSGRWKYIRRIRKIKINLCFFFVFFKHYVQIKYIHNIRIFPVDGGAERGSHELSGIYRRSVGQRARGKGFRCWIKRNILMGTGKCISYYATSPAHTPESELLCKFSGVHYNLLKFTYNYSEYYYIIE